MAALALARKAHAFSCQASHYTLECRKRRDLSVCHLCDGFTKYLVQVGWLLIEQSCDYFQVSALRLDDSSVCHCSERDSIQVVVVSEELDRYSGPSVLQLVVVYRLRNRPNDDLSERDPAALHKP
jgi:hypothetical protein